MITYVQVMIFSQSQKHESETLLSTNKLYPQSLKQLQFIITSERVYVRAKNQVHILNYHLVPHNC